MFFSKPYIWNSVRCNNYLANCARDTSWNPRSIKCRYCYTVLTKTVMCRQIVINPFPPLSDLMKTRLTVTSFYMRTDKHDEGNRCTLATNTVLFMCKFSDEVPLYEPVLCYPPIVVSISQVLSFRNSSTPVQNVIIISRFRYLFYMSCPFCSIIKIFDRSFVFSCFLTFWREKFMYSCFFCMFAVPCMRMAAVSGKGF
jgi:hypothetical protein